MGIVGCLPASEDMNCLSDLLSRVLDPWHESEAQSLHGPNASECNSGARLKGH